MLSIIRPAEVMNALLDKARRKTMAQLDADQRSALKNKRFVLLHSEEDLDADAAQTLAVIREHCNVSMGTI